MNGHILHSMLIVFVAVSDEKRRFLLAEVLNVDGQVFDQRTKREKSFIAWIIYNLNFQIPVTTHRMVIFTPIIFDWMIFALKLGRQVWMSGVFLFAFFFTRGFFHLTEASCGRWIMCYIFQKRDEHLDEHAEETHTPWGEGLEFASYLSFRFDKTH